MRLSVFEGWGALGCRLRTDQPHQESLLSNIGEGCMLAMHTSINDADYTTCSIVFSRQEQPPVVLEQNVWLGEGARVLKGSPSAKTLWSARAAWFHGHCLLT